MYGFCAIACQPYAEWIACSILGVVDNFKHANHNIRARDRVGYTVLYKQTICWMAGRLNGSRCQRVHSTMVFIVLTLVCGGDADQVERSFLRRERHTRTIGPKRIADTRMCATPQIHSHTIHMSWGWIRLNSDRICMQQIQQEYSMRTKISHDRAWQNRRTINARQRWFVET